MKEIFTKQMVILTMVTFLYMCSISMSNPVMAGLCALVGGGGMIMGVIGGLSSFVSLFCRPFLGNLIDHYDRRQLGLIGLLGMGVGGLICTFSPNVYILFWGRLCAGIGLAICSSTFSTWFAASLPPERMGQGMGLYGVVQALSMACAPAIGLWLANSINSRLTCMIAAILNLVSILLVFPLKDYNYSSHQSAVKDESAKKCQFFIPELIPLAILMFLFCVPYNGTTAFLETVVSDRKLAFNAGLYFTIFAIALLITRFALSKFLDNYPYRYFVWMCIPFGIFSMLLLQWMNGFSFMMLSAITLTLSYGIIQPVSQAACMRSVSKDQQGVANCTYYVGMDLGMAFGPIIAGATYQIAGESAVFYIMSLFPLLSVPILFVFRNSIKKL